MARAWLPTGTLTFLFTDLEGSTRLLHEFPDEYGALLETHRALIREAVAATNGIEFGTGGDALFIVFTSAPDAVACAERAQRALQGHDWADATPLKVRMAIHTGDADVVDGDYVGLALHVVARLCSAGHGEQVLLSSTTRALSPATDVVGLGRHELRDVAEPLEIFQLRGDGLRRDFPALRTRSAQPNNLPSTLDRLIGRDLETVEIIGSLQNRRLVTLTGSGGSGKTRLAIAAGSSLVGEFNDGVWLLELAAATTPDQVVALLAGTLRVGERSGAALSDTIIEYLSTRELLLIFDNCEHLIDAVASLAQTIVSRCPNVRILATSRELLGIPGEQAIGVTPLAIGDAERPGDAMLLFIERVTENKPEFAPNEADLALIAGICARLDGLPLAIELAAARTRSIALGQLADRLDDRFRLLTGGARTALGRQRTLEAVVAWSYDLLDDEEQQLFRYLSVFPDSFTLEAAEAVAPTNDRDVIELLGLLVDKSLLAVLPRGDDSRYQMLETIRQYGRDRLVEREESEKAHVQLLGWVMTLTEQLERDMRTAQQDAAIRAVLPERSNARAALEWAMEHDNPRAALRIASAIPVMVTSQRSGVLERLLAETPGLSDERRAQALLTLGNLALELGHFADMSRFTREAADLFAAFGDDRLYAWARYFEVFALWGDPAAQSRAHALAEEMLNVFRDLDDDFGLAYALWVSSQFSDDLQTAQDQAAESERLFRQLGAPFGLAHALEGHALVALKAGKASGSATALLSEALSIFSDADNFGCTAHCLEAVAAALATNGAVEDAAMMLGAAQRLREVVGQQHRAWEREGQLRTQQAFARTTDPAQLDRARSHGTTLSFTEAVERARMLLAGEQPATADHRP